MRPTLPAAALLVALATPAVADVALGPVTATAKRPASPSPAAARPGGGSFPQTVERFPVRRPSPVIYEFPDDDPLLGELPSPPPSPPPSTPITPPVPLDGPYTTPGDVCTILVRDCAATPHRRAVCSGKPVTSAAAEAPWQEVAVYETPCLDDAKPGGGETYRHLAVRTSRGWWFAVVDRSPITATLATRFAVEALGTTARPGGAAPAVELRYSLGLVRPRSPAVLAAPADTSVILVDATPAGPPVLTRRPAARLPVAPPSFPITAPE